ncbi:hypothetical protein C5O19_05650 [Siphonobacter curvatus]|uniref:Uncharacterized protein n=1 Tax=Siphonobacter curvatus TaxID=2094562 RepID=A0A2S7INA5_9BACT|nr:hypothetical protein C5O19_05650 [Siphonobacter curvatus]
MPFPLFVALPGEQVTICLNNQNFSGIVKHASSADTTGNGHKTRYIVAVGSWSVELNETQITVKI